MSSVLTSVMTWWLCVADEVFRSQEPGASAPRPVSAADVVLYGVNIVLPLMSQDLLKVPRFSPTFDKHPVVSLYHFMEHTSNQGWIEKILSEISLNVSLLLMCKVTKLYM